MRLHILAGTALLLFVACSSSSSSDDDSSAGTGGTNSGANGGQANGGTAGKTAGTGGTATGGSAGTTVASAGTGGSAGTTAAAGTTSTGGIGATGGASGSGNSAGGAGSGPIAGGGGALPVGGGGGMPMGGSTSAGAGGASAGHGGSAGTANGGGAGGTGTTHWVGTWANGPQTTESQNLPPSPGLANNTLRQIAHVTIGGSQIRVRISNAYGKSAVTINAVHIANAMSGGASSTIDTASDKALAFSGMPSVTIATGKEVWSDPLDYTLTPLQNVAVTIVFGTQSGDVTGHPGSRTTSYLIAGNHVSDATLSGAATAEHWYFLTGVDVMAPSDAAAIAILGDSITDGRGSDTNGQNRWPDDLAKRLQMNASTSHIAVLNLGIGGNCVVSGGLGPTAVSRYDSDILGQSGVKWVMVLEGVNDIGGGAQASSLTGAFQTFIDKAHQKNLKIYGIPILPFAGNTDYDSTAHQSVRTSVNDWIRAAGHFDASIPSDTAVGDTSNPPKLQSAYDSGDHLHLSPAGYQKIADGIDLTLFSP